jgi:hypothetical protein
VLSLLYISRSRLTGDPPDRQLSEILSAAISRNLGSGITGALVATGKDFAQVLEGEESDVVGVMGSILLDPRHDHVRIISRETISERSFPNWGMALVGHHPETMQLIETIWTAPDDNRLQHAVRGLVRWMREGASARITRMPDTT